MSDGIVYRRGCHHVTRRNYPRRPLPMSMYGVAVVPLIRKLNGCCTQVWYADNSVAAGRIKQVQQWWETLTKESPRFGYFVNPHKTWLVTKEADLEAATSLFARRGLASHQRAGLTYEQP